MNYGSLSTIDIININKMQDFKTPYYLYDEKKIRTNCRYFKNAFAKYFPKFKPLYAVKTNPNPHLLYTILDEGFGLDCSTSAEVWIARRLGASGMFTSNYLSSDDLNNFDNTNIILNLDDNISNIAQLKKLPNVISFRINLGEVTADYALSGKDSKFGIPIESALHAYSEAKKLGVTEFGIHMMIGSNILQISDYINSFKALLECIYKIQKHAGIKIKFINIGGGFGFSYSDLTETLPLDLLAMELRRVFDSCNRDYSIAEPVLYAEPGRIIVADTGLLVASITHIKNGYKKFIGLNVSSNSMPRPAWFNAFHKIEVITNLQGHEYASVVGSICDNSDQFARDRLLPKCKVGDLVVIKDCGAYGYSQSSQFCGHLRPAEYIITEFGEVKLIRQPESIEDLYRSCLLDKLANSKIYHNKDSNDQKLA